MWRSIQYFFTRDNMEVLVNSFNLAAVILTSLTFIFVINTVEDIDERLSRLEYDTLDAR